jgi:hypothetical protein
VIEPAIWEAVATSWSSLLQSARELVRTESWAPARAHWERPELLLAEREGQAPIRHAHPPANGGDAVRYGFAGDGMLVLADRFRPPTSAAWVDVDGARVLIKAAPAGEDWEANLMRVSVPRHALGRLIGVDTRWTGRETFDMEERYGYDDAGRVATIALRRYREAGLQAVDYEVGYDADGEVATIRSIARIPGEPQRAFVNYRRAAVRVS